MLPWTFSSTHLALPVWQETAGQLTRQRRHTCSPKCTVIHGNTHMFWQQSVIRPLPSVCAVLVHVKASRSYSPSHMVSPHFITLLPLWAAVPTALGGVGGLWNIRSCRVWSGGLKFPPFPCFPSDPTPFLPQESSQAIWEVSQFIHRGVCTPLTWSQPSQAPSRGTTPAWLPTKASEAWLPRH